MKYRLHAHISRSEIFSFTSHLSGVIFGLFVLILLVFKTWGIWDHLIVCTVYGLSLISLFAASSTYHINAPRIVSPILYLLMGWMALIPMRVLWKTIPSLSLILLVSGGVSYSIGAVIYALKKPNPKPGFFGFHEIFHIFVLLGAVLHFFVVYLGI